MNYLIAKVKEIFKKNIIVEHNHVGYMIYVSNTNIFEINQTFKLFIYEDWKLDNKSKITKNLFGFLDRKSYEFFVFLLTVQGVGCKTALNIMTNDLNLLIDLIKSENVWSLSNLQGMNLRLANLLLEEIKSSKKFKTLCKQEADYSQIENIIVKNLDISDDIIFSSLKAIGYTTEEIKKTISIFKNKKSNFNNLDDAINECIKIIFINNQESIEKKFN